MGRTALLACPEGGTSLSAMAGLDRSSFNTEPGLRSISFSLLWFCAVCGCRQRFFVAETQVRPLRRSRASSPEGGSQAVRLVAKALGALRKFPTVLLPLPLRKDFPRPGEDVAQRQKGECGSERSELTERALPLSFFATQKITVAHFCATVIFINRSRSVPACAKDSVQHGGGGAVQ